MKSSITCNQTLWRDSWLGQRVQCICFLSSLPLLHPTTMAVFGSSVSPVRACPGLAYSYDWRGFVGAKKKREWASKYSVLSGFRLSACSKVVPGFDSLPDTLGVLFVGHPAVHFFRRVTQVCKNTLKIINILLGHPI